MNIQPHRLLSLIESVFAAAGCEPAEASCVADHLVKANLVGHDSHGVIRVPTYIAWLRAGKVRANQTPRVVTDSGPIAVVDGMLGFGQVMGEHATKLAIEKARQLGVAVVALRNSGHCGRIGHFAELAAAEELVSLHFVNTNGLGILVAPVGGISRRLSANPVAVGIPVAGQPPIIVDISTAAIAEGKIKVALNKQTTVPDGCLIDPVGRPTNDPKTFYGPPPGAILPIGGHKGYALGIMVEALAGALTGNGCSAPNATQLEQGMLTVAFDPRAFGLHNDFAAEMQRFVAFVTSAERAAPADSILMPGEPERMCRERKLRDGIELDDNTWRQLGEVCNSLGVSADNG